MPIAADYPFLNILWSMLIFMGFIMWIWIAIMCFMDIFRRRDIGGFAKAIWIIFIIFIPLLGVLFYLIAYHNGIADRNDKGQEAAQAAFDQQVTRGRRQGRPRQRDRDRAEAARRGHDLAERVRPHQVEGARRRLSRYCRKCPSAAWYSGTSSRNESCPHGEVISMCSAAHPAARSSRAMRAECALEKRQSVSNEIGEEPRRVAAQPLAHAVLLERREVVHGAREVEVGQRVEAREEARALVVQVVLDLEVGAEPGLARPRRGARGRTCARSDSSERYVMWAIIRATARPMFGPVPLLVVAAALEARVAHDRLARDGREARCSSR